MHDPMTQAFSARIPWGWHTTSKGARFRDYIYLFTIWHVDPERGGDEDSCGWSWPHLTPAEKAAANDLITNEIDNVRSWFAAARDDEEAQFQVRRLWRIYKRSLRRWWQHPRWHFWHWKVQIHAVQNFKRWAFSRCTGCGKRFKWGYAPTGMQWNGVGPRWFRSEPETYHRECAPRSPRRVVEMPPSPSAN